MNEETDYSSWSALAAAYKEAAKKVPSTSVQDHLRFAQFDRFLTRVFAEEERSEWLLKGGTGMLARIPESRTTKDVDLVTTDRDLDQAQEELVTLAERDIGDHVVFRLKAAKPTGQGGNQPGVQARAVLFTCHDVASDKELGEVRVDLAVEQPPVGTVEVVEPRNRLALSKNVITRAYRLFPVSDQIADKVWATVQDYGDGRPSTREKDLVDLVVISRTQSVELSELHIALEAERITRGADTVSKFRVPASWGRRYTAMARTTPACAGLESVWDAQAYVAKMIEPGLDPQARNSSAVWSTETGWAQPGSPSGEPDRPDSGTTRRTEELQNESGEEMIDLYHRTTVSGAQQILETGQWVTRENTQEAYASTDVAGQAEGYGEAVIHIRAPEEEVLLEDEFPSGEQHYRVPFESIAVVDAFTVDAEGAPQDLISSQEEPDAAPGISATEYQQWQNGMNSPGRYGPGIG